MANLAFKYEETKGYWDLFVENGHLAKSKGLDSQLLMSLFVDSRADDSEQPVKQFQRGWAGNPIVNYNFPNYEIGCKQWLYTEQAKNILENAQNILDTVKNDGLQWMLDDNYAQDIETSINEISFAEGSLSLDFRFKIDENETITKNITLWNNTQFN